jgi:outer membrane protein TolC
MLALSTAVVVCGPRSAWPDAGAPPAAHPIGLSAALALALERNFALLSAADSLASARFNEAAVRADFYPKLTPRYARAQDSRIFGFDASQRVPWSGATLAVGGLLSSTPESDSVLPRSSSLRLALTQPLLRGFGPNATNFNLTNARRARQAQERLLTVARRRLAVEVTFAFYQVIEQRQLVAVARQSLERSRGLREASGARLEVGLVSKLDVFRAELQEAQSEEALVRAEAGLEAALEGFRKVLGLPLEDPAEPADVDFPGEPEGDEPPLEALLARAHENREDLAEARDRVEDARRAASLARQNLLPQLDVGLAVSQFGQGSGYFDNRDSRVGLLVTTSYPIERAADRAARATAELDLAARQRDLVEREREVDGDVRQALRELARQRKSATLQRKGVEAAEQQLRLATLRYQRGLASNFDVVDAESSLLVARSALASLQASLQVARLELQRATAELDPDALAGRAP